MYQSTHYTYDENLHDSIHIGRAILEGDQFVLWLLVPNQRIVELLRISLLHFFPEDKKSSLKYDSELSTTFSESFSLAVDKFSRDLKNSGEQKCIIIDVTWNICSTFLDTVIQWVNPPRAKKYRDSFHIEFQSCLQGRVQRSPIVMESAKIHMEKWQIILSLLERPEELEKGNSPDATTVQIITSEAIGWILA